MNNLVKARQIRAVYLKNIMDNSKLDEYWEELKQSPDSDPDFIASTILYAENILKTQKIDNSPHYSAWCINHFSDLVKLGKPASESMIGAYVETTDKIKQIRERARTFVTDSSIPLDDRWEIYVRLEMGTHDVYIIHFDHDESINAKWEDVFNDGEYTSRRQVVNVVNRIFDFEEDLDRGWGIDWVTQEEIDKLKEFVMKNNIKSYEFDW